MDVGELVVERAIAAVLRQRLDHGIDDLAAGLAPLLDQLLRRRQGAALHNLPVFWMLDALLLGQLAALHVDDQDRRDGRIELLVALELERIEGPCHGAFPVWADGSSYRLLPRMSLIEFEIFVDFPVADMSAETCEFEPLYCREDPHELRAQCCLEGLVTVERVERGIQRLREFFQRLVVLAGGIAGLVAQAGLALDTEEA